MGCASHRALFALLTKPNGKAVCLGPTGNDPSPKTKGSALVIPPLPPGAQERGAEKLPHTPERRLDLTVAGQVFASPVHPFDGNGKAVTDEPGARHLTWDSPAQAWGFKRRGATHYGDRASKSPCAATNAQHPPENPGQHRPCLDHH